METNLFLLLPVAVVAIAIVILFVISAGKNKGNGDKKNKKFKGKDSNAIIREANKRLSQNPKDAEALLALAEAHFNDGRFDKALRTYNILIDLCATNKELDEFEINLRYAISAMKLQNFEEAYKSFLICKTMNPDVFEVNFNLGYLEFRKGNFEKAVALLQSARQKDPEHGSMLKYLGHSLFKITKYKDAAGALRKALEIEPEDKESLFVLGQVYHNLGQNDQALRIFSHLRPDPNLGPNAALYAGTIHVASGQFDKAVLDFEIGLRHNNIKKETALELKYRLAASYAKKQDMGRALKLLQEIQKTAPGYRDVPALLEKYAELNSNRNLQTYLIAPTSDFVTLCRKLTNTIFPGAKVQITDISVTGNDYADILAEISTRKWEDVVLFRYVRTNSQVGELILRDLYARIKELRAGRGFCLSAGEFTEGAKQFVEARLIDLVEKEGLMRKMKEIDR
ncbi:tetratricopeptide repeat protein [Sediminispirochaeta bajacaliforniensis]|uniref:tetratricopeptide repeat protein n=1 Tax=Sediminispirochaeta bajacaliforniensis TaxID=148 RepID=UPI00036EBCAF|nr:tetratricopeptide repeat protein [Sediminispirochaeta bajacaliforniensis]